MKKVDDVLGLRVGDDGADGDEDMVAANMGKLYAAPFPDTLACIRDPGGSRSGPRPRRYEAVVDSVAY
uniref:Uncharacterized protein n=1 Tax=Mycena chlorophos TaxID=658473 RepID=A0ABQ0L5G0_MYCCL|nr:predicted protein [Mycena chlorophos]